MVAVEEGTNDNDNAKLTRKMPPEPTQQMKETTLFASKEIDRIMFEEGNADNIELGDMGDSNDEGAEADIHNEGGLSEKCWSHQMNQLETMQTTLTM